MSEIEPDEPDEPDPREPDPREPDPREPGPATDVEMDQRLSALERVLGPVLGTSGDAVRAVSDRLVTPAWNRVTGI